MLFRSAAFDEDGELEAQLATAEAGIFRVRGERDAGGVAKPPQYTSEYVDYFMRSSEEKQSVNGVLSGFSEIDRVMGGFESPHLYVLGARPGMGKSALAVNVAIEAAVKGTKRVAIFSLEMSKKQIMNRSLSYITRIPSENIQKPWTLSVDEKKRVMATVGQMSESRLFIDDSPALTPSQIRARCLRLQAEFGLDLVIIDHLHIMRPDTTLRGNRNLEITEITASLAALGKQLEAPILLLCQLSRGVEGRADRRPMLSDLRDSGTIEQDAYAVMFLYRDAYYNDDSAAGNGAEVLIAKNREGATGKVDII